MNRIKVLNEIMNRKDYATYVEIGTYKGASFFPLKCRNKIAVDPFMQISWRRKLRWMVQNPYNFGNRFFEQTSDDFFFENSKMLQKMELPALFFIDGLHTFRASLRDVLNSLRFSKEGGLIVMHDCYPPHLAAATPANSFKEAKEKGVEGWTGQWCGDVWKTIIYLKKMYPRNLEVMVLDTDFGLGIVKRMNDENFVPVIDEDLFSEIDSLPYKKVRPKAPEMLNLKDLEFLKLIQL